MQPTTKMHLIFFGIALNVLLGVTNLSLSTGSQKAVETETTQPKTQKNKAIRYIDMDEADTEPMFPCGWNQWKNYQKENLRMPANETKELKNVGISFDVTETGAIENIRLRARIPQAYAAAAMDMIAAMPNWEPATKNGVPVTAESFVTVSFLM